MMHRNRPLPPNGVKPPPPAAPPGNGSATQQSGNTIFFSDLIDLVNALKDRYPKRTKDK